LEHQLTSFSIQGELIKLIRQGREITEIPGLRQIDNNLPANIFSQGHKEYDEYVTRLLTSKFDPNLDVARKKFETQYPDIYLLLKGFDRAYWFKYFTAKREQTKLKIELGRTYDVRQQAKITTEITEAEQAEQHAAPLPSEGGRNQSICGQCPLPFAKVPEKEEDIGAVELPQED